MTWDNFIPFKKFMEAMIFRVFRERSSDGFEGRTTFFPIEREDILEEKYCLCIYINIFIDIKI